MFVFHLSLRKPKDNVLVLSGGRTKSLKVHLQRERILYLFLLLLFFLPYLDMWFMLDSFVISVDRLIRLNMKCKS